MTLWPLCHRKTALKKRHKIFPFWAPLSQSKFLAKPVPTQKFYSKILTMHPAYL